MSRQKRAETAFDREAYETLATELETLPLNEDAKIVIDLGLPDNELLACVLDGVYQIYENDWDLFSEESRDLILSDKQLKRALEAGTLKAWKKRAEEEAKERAATTSDGEDSVNAEESEDENDTPPDETPPDEAPQKRVRGGKKTTAKKTAAKKTQVTPEHIPRDANLEGISESEQQFLDDIFSITSPTDEQKVCMEELGRMANALCGKIILNVKDDILKKSAIQYVQAAIVLVNSSILKN